VEFTACLLKRAVPDGLLTSLTVCDAYCYFVDQAVIDVTKQVTLEYLTTTDNIVEMVDTLI